LQQREEGNTSITTNEANGGETSSRIIVPKKVDNEVNVNDNEDMMMWDEESLEELLGSITDDDFDDRRQ
jgi:hypothetical protein